MRPNIDRRSYPMSGQPQYKMEKVTTPPITTKEREERTISRI